MHIDLGVVFVVPMSFERWWLKTKIMSLEFRRAIEFSGNITPPTPLYYMYKNDNDICYCTHRIIHGQYPIIKYQVWQSVKASVGLVLCVLVWKQHIHVNSDYLRLLQNSCHQIGMKNLAGIRFNTHMFSWISDKTDIYIAIRVVTDFSLIK